jgi:hypothetical protein
MKLKVVELDAHYDLGIQSQEELERVSASVVDGGYSSNEELLAAVQASIFQCRNDILAFEKVKATKTAASTCSICSEGMQEINLLGGRPAFYCKAHRVVNPAPL